ncbi:MAG: hypothetical protein AB7O66_18500 [Limisphaerales bacterium]
MIATAESIKRAGEILAEIETLQAELVGLFGSTRSPGAPGSPRRRGRPPGAAGSRRGRKRGTMSAEGRARIGAAAKARWARFHASKAKAAKKGA